MNTNYHQLNRVYAPIIIGITVLFAIFVLKPIYTDYLDTSTGLIRIEADQKAKEEKLKSLLAMKEEVSKSGSGELALKVKKINQKWDTSEIMKRIMLTDYSRSTSLAPTRISIGSISVTRGSKLPSGISLGSVNVSVKADTLADMIDYITYLTTASDTLFLLDSINLPIDTSPSDTSVNG
jgi:hypothetical protein